MVGIVCAPFLSQGFDRWWTAFPWGPLPMRRNLLLDYVAGLFFSLNILAVGRLVAAIALITPLTVRLNVWTRPRLARLIERTAPAVAPVGRVGL